MRKVFLFLCSFFLLLNVHASNGTAVKPVYASQVMIPVGKTGKTISLLELSSINIHELQALTGKKMTRAERWAFKRSQVKLRKNINADGTISGKKMQKFFRKSTGPETGFHGVGFLLGFFVGVVGVILAYVINDESDKKNRVRWAWIGFIISVVLTIGLYALLLASVP
jgi:hypothetical protein